MSKRNTNLLYNCDFCGKEYNPFNSNSSKHFCSKECYTLWLISSKKKSREKKCPWCGSYFIQAGGEKYCSVECRKEYAKCYYGNSGTSVPRRKPLDDDAKDANDLHTTYGKMVADRNSRITHMTKWTIKELADGTHIKVKAEE